MRHGPRARGRAARAAGVVAKAWEHVERIGRRARWAPRRALVTGAGPVGLLATLLGSDLEVHLYDRHESG